MTQRHMPITEIVTPPISPAHFPDSSSKCVWPASTGSQLWLYPSQTTHTASCAPGHHHILRNHTIDTLQISNIYHNSISRLLGCFAGQHTTLYFLQNTSALAKSTRQTDYLHLSPHKATTSPAAISHNNTRGCYGNLGPLSVAPRYNTQTQQ